MNGKHCILDFETMGTNVHDCVVLDCSWFVFEPDKMLSSEPYTSRSITETQKFKFSIKQQQLDHDWKVYPDTVKWWSEQASDVRKKILPSDTDRSTAEFVTEFHTSVSKHGKIANWWSRSNSFDPPILTRIFAAEGKADHLHSVLPHWKVRDTRTFIDAKLDFPKDNSFVPIKDEAFWNKVFQAHDSSWDILADVLRIQAILRAEEDLEMVVR